MNTTVERADAAGHPREGASPTTFRAPLRTRLGAIVLLAGCLWVVWMAVLGFEVADEQQRMLLWVTIWFPALMVGVAALRLLVFWTRRITVQGSHIDHRQLFKSFRWSLDQVQRLELRVDKEEQVDALRLVHAGQCHTLDRAGIDDFGALVRLLKARISAEKLRVVEVFEPLEQDGRS